MQHKDDLQYLNSIVASQGMSSGAAYQDAKGVWNVRTDLLRMMRGGALKDKGKYIEKINDMRAVKQRSRFDFSKFKQFATKYQLVYLTEQYINQVKVKSIMYK